MDLSFENLFPSLGAFFRWCSHTPAGAYINGLDWAATFIQTVHLLGLTVVLGSILLVNLRLLGVVGGWSAAQLARTLAPFVTAGLITLLVTGVLLFLSSSMKYFSNGAFGPKMLLLTLAVVFHYTLYRRALMKPVASKVAACVSLMLWFGVGAAGRAIGWV